MTTVCSSVGPCNLPRTGNGRALRSWRLQQQREFSAAGARAVFQQQLEVSVPVLGQRLAYASSLNPTANERKSRKDFEPVELEGEDRDLLRRIDQRNRREGWTLGNGSGRPKKNKFHPSMPWCASTKAQWDSDLMKTKREAITSERASGFFSRREHGRPARPPEPQMPQAQTRSSSCSSTSSTTSSSS